jgi:hypothetical protein
MTSRKKIGVIEDGIAPTSKKYEERPWSGNSAVLKCMKPSVSSMGFVNL